MIIKRQFGGGIGGLIDRLKAFNKPKVYVGVPSSTNARQGATNNATILATQTLGSPKKGIPQRDAMRPPLIANAQKYTESLALGLRNATINNTDPMIVYEKIGMLAVGDIKQYFVSGSFVPLKQKTIDAKGSSKPLISTGELRSSISHEVRK